MKNFDVDHYPFTIEQDDGCIWLLDEDGEKLCDLQEMRLLDFGSYINVEGGLHCYCLDAREWRSRLVALGLEPY